MPPRTPTSTLKCVAVNVNGLHDRKKRLAFFDWLLQQRFDVVILSETHSRTDAEAQQWV
jgi:exonuclease III